jgi:hypothetical protein
MPIFFRTFKMIEAIRDHAGLLIFSAALLACIFLTIYVRGAKRRDEKEVEEREALESTYAQSYPSLPTDKSPQTMEEVKVLWERLHPDKPFDEGLAREYLKHGANLFSRTGIIGASRVSVSDRNPNTSRVVMQIIVTLAVLAAAIFIVLSSKQNDAQQKWAFGAIGTILGYWLKG